MNSKSADKSPQYYYCDNGGQKQGPLPINTLRSAMDVGRISRETTVCRIGDNAWIPLLVILGLASREPSVSQTEMSEQLTETGHPNEIAHTLIAIFLPIVGCIIGIVFMCKNAPCDRKLGSKTVAISLAYAIVWMIFWLALCR